MVPMAADIAQALGASPAAQASFDALPPSHKAEYLTWIDAAKKSETRLRRIVAMVEKLSAGHTRAEQAGHREKRA